MQRRTPPPSPSGAVQSRLSSVQSSSPAAQQAADGCCNLPLPAAILFVTLERYAKSLLQSSRSRRRRRPEPSASSPPREKVAATRAQGRHPLTENRVPTAKLCGFVSGLAPWKRLVSALITVLCRGHKVMMATDLLWNGLTYPWTYGVTQDGRIFFVK